MRPATARLDESTRWPSLKLWPTSRVPHLELLLTTVPCTVAERLRTDTTFPARSGALVSWAVGWTSARRNLPGIAAVWTQYAPPKGTERKSPTLFLSFHPVCPLAFTRRFFLFSPQPHLTAIIRQETSALARYTVGSASSCVVRQFFYSYHIIRPYGPSSIPYRSHQA